MYDVIRTKNVSVDFLSTNDAPWHSQNPSDRGYEYPSAIPKLTQKRFLCNMGVQKFDGIQEKIEGGKNSSLTTILSIWNCVMGSSLLSHGSYLLNILNTFYDGKYWIEIKYAMGVRKSWFHANGIHHGFMWYYVLLYCLSLHKSCGKGTRKIRKNCWPWTTRISG